MTRRITDSISIGPLHGLIVLGLVAVLVDLTASGAGRTWLKPAAITGDCVYEVYQDDRSLGTVFLKQSENLTEILSALGAELPSSENCGKIPCNRAIKLSSKYGTVRVDKIHGSHLIAAGRRIDVNLADAQDLEAVPGIGPKLAERIVAERNARGSFGSLGDLRRVPGIGAKKLSEVTQYVEVKCSEISSQHHDMGSPARRPADLSTR